MTAKVDPRHARLTVIARTISDHALAELARHERECRVTRAHLTALEPVATLQPVVPFSVLATAALHHERWAEPQRIRLNEQLARQTVARIQAEELARQAFGRAQVLKRLIGTARQR